MKYALVPLEGDIYLIKATESRVLTEEELEKLKNVPMGNSPQYQEILENVWNS